ncbi:MAG: RNA-directed DNA polymerase [Alphaproteobacteria bacterium]
MEKHFQRALINIAKHGDTDVFPYPLENSFFFDNQNDVIKLLKEIHKNFDAVLDTDPPFNESYLSPVGYTGFRWVTQIDPLWNAYFLGIIISIGEEIEKSRISTAEGYVYSYRFASGNDEKLFDPDIGWHAFHRRSLELAESYETVAICDISDFYQRVRHHKLENALTRLNNVGDIPHRVIDLLKNFSATYSHGLPVGGPAARLLAELLLSKTDRLLKEKGIKFCRFVDDYHLFASSEEEIFDALIFLSEKLVNNEGLALQKAKTRIMSSTEFKNTSPLATHDEEENDDADAKTNAKVFLSLSLRFDPYSPTAEEDYETLRSEINKFDIIGLLRKEVAKSRIDIAVTRQIVKSLRFISDSTRDQAVLSTCDSLHNLYPIFPTVMIVLKHIWADLSDSTKTKVGEIIRTLFKEDSRLIKTKVNQLYACRVLSSDSCPENIELLTNLFITTESVMIKRDIILAMFNWRNDAWLSDLRSQFRAFPPPLRRAFIIGSYALGEEGSHWRQHNKGGFSDFEKLVQNWAASKSQQQPGKVWQVPL